MMDARAGPDDGGDAPEVSKLRASEAHLQELRKIHSMLHSAMDALIKDLNANEAARLLILLDDRLTSLINTADVEHDQDTESGGDREKPSPAMEPKAPPAGRMTAEKETAEKPASADRPMPSWRRQPPPEVPEATVLSPQPSRAEPPAEPPIIPSEPILAVPPAPGPVPAPAAAMPSFEEMIASAAKANLATPQPEEAAPEPPAEPAAEASSELAPYAEEPTPPEAEPIETAPDPVPTTDGEGSSERSDEEPEWIEEDLEDGADLREELQAEPPKQGLAGRLLSRFRLPGLGRRHTETQQVEQAGPSEEPEETFEDEEAEVLEEAIAPPEPEPEPLSDPKIRRLHLAADQLSAGQLLDEAAHRTGNRIELRKVDLGLDLVVKGLAKPLGTVRIAEIDGHVLYQPGFGLDLPNREPNRADLEIWTKAMGDVVVRLLEDIARRRQKGGNAGAGSSE